MFFSHMNTVYHMIALPRLVRVWRGTQPDPRGEPAYTPPRLSSAYPYIVTAAVVHGVYNAFAVFMGALIDPF